MAAEGRSSIHYPASRLLQAELGRSRRRRALFACYAPLSRQSTAMGRATGFAGHPEGHSVSWLSGFVECLNVPLEADAEVDGSLVRKRRVVGRRSELLYLRLRVGLNIAFSRSAKAPRARPLFP
ncbi:MAG: hypothetical protein ABWK01_05795 [Infirmifilum sp.]